MWTLGMALLRLRGETGIQRPSDRSRAEGTLQSPQRILASLGSRRTQVRMLFESSTLVVNGVVERVATDCTWIRADHPPPSDLSVRGMVVFSFWHQGAAFAVTTIVVGEERAGETWRVALHSPDNLPRFECRTAFRVPVVDLSVAFRWGAHSTTAHLPDISYGGCCVELPTGSAPPPVGTSIAVELDPATALTMRGSVRSISAPRVRIFFDDCRQGSALVPPAGLVRFVDDLQRAWIATGVERSG